MWRMVASADREAKLCLLGVMLVKFATGMAAIWGTCNIYFFSYFMHRGIEVTAQTNSLILLCALIPTSCAVLLSNPFARLLGYRAAVRICAFFFLLSPLVINWYCTVASFAFFWLVIPLSCFCLGAMPVLNCLWSHFRRDLSKVSGLAVVAFSLGMIFWNLLFLFLANPQNIGADINQHNMPIFPEEVAKNVFKASNTAYVLAGLCYIVGSFLLNKKEEGMLEVPMENDSKMKATEVLALDSEPVVEIQRVVSRISGRDHASSQRVQTLSQGLRDKRFLLIFGVSAFMPIYLIYLVLNVKLIYMPLINDDHFLSYCSALVTVSAVVGAPLWGYVSDAYGFRTTLAAIVTFDCFVKIFGLFCTQKWSLATLFFMLGVNDKGLLTIVGPGLIEIFGLEIATELIPYKGLAIFLGYVLAPSFQIFFWGVLSLRATLFIFFLLSLIALILSLRLQSMPCSKMAQELQER